MENIPLSKIWSLRTDCPHIDYRWQVFLLKKQNLPAGNSNAIISKTKKVSSIFYCLSEIYIKSPTLRKKDQVHTSTISNIIDSERSSYLNVLKEWLRNVLTSLKHCWKLSGSNLVQLFNFRRLNWDGKHPSW